MPAGRGGLAKPSIRQRDLHAAAGVPGDVAQRVQHGVGAARATAAGSGRRRTGPGRGRRWGTAVIAVSRGRLARGQPVAVVEQRGARRRPSRSGRPGPRSARAPRSRRRAADALGRRGAARGQEPGPVGDGAQQVGQLAAAVRGDVERHDQRSAAAACARCRPGGCRGTGPRAGGRTSRARSAPVPAGRTARTGRHSRPPPRLAPRRRRQSSRRPARCAGTSGVAARRLVCPARPVRAARQACPARPVRAIGAVLARVHHDLRGSVMTAIGASSSSAWLAAASICSRCTGLSRLTGVQLPSGCCWASSSVRSRRSQVYADGSPR